MNRQTTLANYKKNEVERQWWLVDATDLVLGRMAVKLARILMGKTKPIYTPHHDVGDFVVLINADKVRVTGDKLNQGTFQTFSGHPSGQKTYTYKWMLENQPELLIERVVRRMMPKGKRTMAQINKLKIYRGAEHPHAAQEPKPLAL